MILTESKVSRLWSFTLARQRRETLDSLTPSACTCAGATGTGAGTRAAAASTAAHTASTGGGLWWGIGHARHAGSEVVDITDNLLGKRLHTAHNRGGKVCAGE